MIMTVLYRTHESPNIVCILTALKDQLRLSGEASDEYRQAADRLELTLREQTTTNQQIQDTLEKKNEQLQTGQLCDQAS